MADTVHSTRKWTSSAANHMNSARLRYELLGANLVNVASQPHGDLTIYRGVGQNNKGLRVDMADTTNNNLAFEVVNAGTGKGAFLDQNGNGIALDIDSEATTVDVLNVAATTLTTGNGIDLECNALTTGIGIQVRSSATAINGAGRLLYVNHSGATSTSGIVAEIITAATDETVPLKVSTSGTGECVQLEGGGILEDQETVTASAPAIQTWGSTNIDSNANAVAATLAAHPGGAAAVGAMKHVVMTEASNSSTLTIAVHETEDSEIATFDAVDEYGLFVWTGTEWATVKSTCTFV